MKEAGLGPLFLWTQTLIGKPCGPGHFFRRWQRYTLAGISLMIFAQGLSQYHQDSTGSDCV
ncbi:MAG: hypothetical protein COB09_05855 [Thalassobium sp.]|jgi:hypothetical protein|nr:MAG: hypothetical protein COB09_05855 [Thalassobium sp.]